ncbi:TadE/TadG family type IV pilus assembly protein [Yersinia vastinensis]|uniref:TadE/TadG family type IV pilus assembly protein n=1 Tax=Yersinia vastinensis TaxID=2890318 RepID=UPI0011A71FDE|nr:TadE family protein [Yersinia vastinensis]
MKRSITLFFRQNNGSITIEYAILFTLFIFMLLASAEISRLLYISSSLDLAISEAAKSAKNKKSNDNSSYLSVLKQNLVKQKGMLGIFITKDNQVGARIFFYQNLSDIINNNPSDNTRSPLAKYTVSYLYHPIFFPFSTHWSKTLLSREVIFVQEN